MGFENLLANFGLINLIALLAVAAIGLPHGAFDGAIAVHLGFMKRFDFFIRFLFTYILLTVFVVILWLAFPTASLIIFLLISALHFGFGDSRAEFGWFRWVQVFAHGGGVVIGISQFHKLEVDKVFKYLTGQDSAVVWLAIDVASIVLVFVFLIYAWHALWNKRWRLGFMELNLLLFAFYFISPLVGFAFYFCCVHSLRHLLFLWRYLKETLQSNYFYLQAISFTISSWIMGGIAYWYCSEQMSGEAALLRVIFIGLAALTVPHMILVDGFFRRRLKVA